MSSETIVTAIFLITAVVAAGILTSQVFPAIYTMSGSVSTSARSADQSLRTDIAIVNSFSLNGTGEAHVWLKNTGSTKMQVPDLEMSSIFVGNPGNIGMVKLNDPAEGWSYEILENQNNGYWDPKETLSITVKSARIPGDYRSTVYFQIVLPDGTKRSEEFTVS
ncbi:MAG TPA: flagellin [Methanomicrobiales archaeon]|jgi:flagellar protein FlaG|nr:flagellin [Methanomicrobiales archaeon]